LQKCHTLATHFPQALDLSQYHQLLGKIRNYISQSIVLLVIENHKRMNFMLILKWEHYLLISGLRSTCLDSLEALQLFIAIFIYTY